MSPASEEQVLEAAIKVATEETAADIAPDRADAVLRRVRADLDEPAKRSWSWAIPATLVPVAIAVALFVVPRRPETVFEPAAVARLIYLGGQAGLDPSRRLERITLADGEHLDVELPAGRASLFGPLVAAFTPDAVILGEGRAVFSIDPRGDRAPFVVRAAQGEVVVHGTVFAVKVAAGALEDVSVEHGKVEVKRKDRPAEFVGNRQRSAGAGVRDEAVDLQPSFDAPWWPSGERRGFLAIESDPSGADVELDGHTIGRTPLLLTWRPGRVALGLKKAGYRDATAEVEVGSDGVSRSRTELVAEDFAKVIEVETGPMFEPDAPATPKEKASRRIAQRLMEAGRCVPLEREVSRLVPAAKTARQKALLEVMVAECQLRRGEKQRALDRFRRVAEIYPSTTGGEGAQFEAAKLEEDLGRRNEALGSLDAYLSRYPEGRFAEAALLRRCELLVRFQRLSDAEACLDRFQKRHPAAIRSNPAVLLAADLARVRGRHADAIESYRRYLKNAPNGDQAERAHFHLIEGLVATKDPQARPQMAEFLEKYGASPRADDVRRWYSQ